MDCQQMIHRMEKVRVRFEHGMSEDELCGAEAFFQFRFPKEIREFLSAGVPVGSSFFSFRDLTENNLMRFRNFQDSVESGFRFDLENNRDVMLAMLQDRLDFEQDTASFDDAVIEYLHKSVRLIPFYAHRCFFDGMDDMPMVSFWQATDIIFCGGTFENYLENEFLKGERILENMEDKMKHTGIWYDIIG